MIYWILIILLSSTTTCHLYTTHTRARVSRHRTTTYIYLHNWMHFNQLLIYFPFHCFSNKMSVLVCKSVAFGVSFAVSSVPYFLVEVWIWLQLFFFFFILFHKVVVLPHLLHLLPPPLLLLLLPSVHSKIVWCLCIYIQLRPIVFLLFVCFFKQVWKTLNFVAPTSLFWLRNHHTVCLLQLQQHSNSFICTVAMCVFRLNDKKYNNNKVSLKRFFWFASFNSNVWTTWEEEEEGWLGGGF